MRKIDIKTAFNGEVAFYQKVIADETLKRELMKALDIGDIDDFVANVRTADGRYADVVVYNRQEEAYLVIEFQVGALDSIHSTKILYYMYDNGVTNGVLVAEEVTENMRDFVKDLNENHGHNVSILRPLIFKMDDGKIFIHWEWYYQPDGEPVDQDDNETVRQPRDKELSRKKWPLPERLWNAKSYYQEKYGVELNDYDHECLGAQIATHTRLQIVFNSIRNSLEFRIYSYKAKDAQYFEPYEKIMQDFAQVHQLEFKDTSTSCKKIYRVDLPMEGTDQEQAIASAEMYFKLNELAATQAPK